MECVGSRLGRRTVVVGRFKRFIDKVEYTVTRDVDTEGVVMTSVAVENAVEVVKSVVDCTETTVVVCVINPRRCSVTVTVGSTEGSCTH